MEGSFIIGFPTKRSATTRRSSASVGMLALCLVAVLTVTSFPLGGRDAVSAGPTHPGQQWDEQHRFSGNCTQYPDHDYFSVNSSALSIVIVVNFTMDRTFPGANIVIYGPDSFVLVSEVIGKFNYSKSITNISKYGLWRVAVSINSCSYDHPIFYRLSLTVSNRFLAAPTVSASKVKQGADVRLDAGNLNLTSNEDCRFDLGDKHYSGWSNKTNSTARYSTPGTYGIRVMVRDRSVSGGNVTGWSDAVFITVEAEAKPLPTLDAGQGIAMVLAMVALPLILMGLILRRALQS